jgi:amino acid transporter
MGQMGNIIHTCLPCNFYIKSRRRTIMTQMNGNGGTAIRKEAQKLKRELTLLPLFGLMYFTVCGGSFGIEPLISGSGPGLAMLLIILTPIFFSIPNVLMVRELSTMMPVQGGYYHWVKTAFGPFAGFLAGWNNWVVSWLDVSIYPVLAVTYLGFFFPQLDTGITLGGFEIPAWVLDWLVAGLIIWGISYMQIRGARLAGLFTNWLGILLMLPLFILGFLGIYNWFTQGGPTLPFLPSGEDINFGSLTAALSTGLFVVMWNYMGWELPSAAGDEVVNPRKTYPAAMTLVLIAAIATYAIPVLGGLYGGGGDNGSYVMWGAEASSDAGIGADLTAQGVSDQQIQAWGVDPASSSGWEFPSIGHAVANKVAGPGFALFLGGWLTLAAVMSMIGLFTGNSLGGSRVPFALAEDGMFPRWLTKVHDKYGTPYVAIIFVGVIFWMFSLSAFAFLVVADVFLQCLVILAEFAAMWKLRYSMPDKPRDRVPGGVLGMVLVTIFPTAVILLAFYSQYASEGFNSIGWALALMAIGVVLYFPIRRYYKPGVPDVDPFEAGPDEA